MPKLGQLYEQVVADIVQSFDEALEVTQGTWVDGPYGRRDRDVTFVARSGGRSVRVLIECKDYNPRTTGRVGIELIDALDSKRHDLNIDLAMICSNAGFTKPALRKAQAVGISTIGALRAGDHRIQFQIHDVIYTRKLTVPVNEIQVNLYPDSPAFRGATLDKFSFGSLLLMNWVTYRVDGILAVNPVVNSRLRGAHQFAEPV